MYLILILIIYVIINYGIICLEYFYFRIVCNNFILEKFLKLLFKRFLFWFLEFEGKFLNKFY